MRFALTGPMYSGKTTLANYLEERYSYININYSRTLKHIACDMLNAVDYQELFHLSDELTVADIEANKPKYRAFLQEIGTICGFDNGGFVDKVCEQLDNYPAANAVFDNVRYPAQFEKLQKKGFVLVRLVDPTNVASQRGVITGADHEAERGMPFYAGEIHVDAAWPTTKQAEYLTSNAVKGVLLHAK